MGVINIADLDIATVLVVLYQAAKVADPEGSLPEGLSIETANSFLGANPWQCYVAKCYGREIHVDFSLGEGTAVKTIDGTRYNEINGKKAAENAIEAFRDTLPQVVSDLSPAQLLMELYKASIIPEGDLGHRHPKCLDPLAVEEAEKIISGDKWVDRVHGRPIKVDFSSPIIDPIQYDQLAGTGTFRDIVQRMRQKSLVESESSRQN